MHTTQKVPNIAPLKIAKSIVTPYDAVGIQIAKTLILHIKVKHPATSILPYLSLKTPMNGLPSAVPRFKKPEIFADWDLESPMDIAKSDRENNRVMYPSRETKDQARSKSTSY